MRSDIYQGNDVLERKFSDGIDRTTRISNQFTMKEGGEFASIFAVDHGVT